MVETRAFKLLKLATHPGTPDNERDAAFRAFRTEVQERGGLDQLLNGGSGQRPAPAPYVPFNAKLQRIAELEAEVLKRDNFIDALEKNAERLIRENERLRNEKTSLEAAARRNMKIENDGRMSYEAFAKQATTRLNDYSSWQINFQRQTGIPRSKMAQWRSRGWVDAEAVEALKTLKPVRVVSKYTSGWTIAEVNRLRRLLQQGKTEKETAELLSEEFGRLVTENTIKSLKTQSRNRTGVFRNEAYGPPIGQPRSTLSMKSTK